MAPRVLVSDKLSETAVQIFRDRGVEVDYLDLAREEPVRLKADRVICALPAFLRPRILPGSPAFRSFSACPWVVARSPPTPSPALTTRLPNFDKSSIRCGCPARQAHRDRAPPAMSYSARARPRAINPVMSLSGFITSEHHDSTQHLFFRSRIVSRRGASFRRS